MSDDKGKRKLGRGLSALLGGDLGATLNDPAPEAEAVAARDIRKLAVSALQPGRYQPRRRFDGEAMDALVSSVREKGVVLPLLVRPLGQDRYEIVAGERRWRAAQLAQLHDVPVVVRELSDAEALEIALIENIQRADLTPVEEAEGYRRLIEEFQYTQEILAANLGKSRTHITNLLRLLKLPDLVKVMIDTGKLSVGHAKVLVGLPDPVATELAHLAVQKGLSVRQVEKLAAEAKAPPAPAKPVEVAPPTEPRDPNVVSLERDLSLSLGLSVAIEADDKRKSAGRLVIHYTSPEQLDDVIMRLGQPSPAR